METATQFTPWASLGGGVLIGAAAILLMAVHGRIAGMTAILSGIIPPLGNDWTWRFAFLVGAIIAPLIYLSFGGVVPFAVPVSNTALVIGGLIVGGGVFFGSGCTSGHGVCGLARLSPRSLVATGVFMLATFITVFFVRHVFEVVL